MTLTLTLIRHAKSDWADPSLEDHDRPLNGRGIASAKALGPWLAERSTPSQVFCSTATRTQQTWDLIAEALPKAELTLVRGLYHAPALRMMEVLVQATAPSVAMIGHNPGIADFAERLARQAPSHPQFFQYPTGAATIFEFDAPDWSVINTGVVTDFVVPRDLV